MPLPNIQDARNLTDQELTDKIIAVKRQLFQLRFQQATRQLQSGFHQFKHARHELAQLMTVQRERQISLAQEDTSILDESSAISMEQSTPSTNEE